MMIADRPVLVDLRDQGPYDHERRRRYEYECRALKVPHALRPGVEDRLH